MTTPARRRSAPRSGQATVDDSEAVEEATGRVEIPANAIIYPTPAIDSDPPDHVFVVARGGADWYLVEYPAEQAWRHAVSETLRDTLDAAIAAGDDRRGRRLARKLVESEGDDVALEHIARRAAEGATLAVELLVEAIDDSGVARRLVGSLLLDETAIDEVTQDTLVTAASSIGSFRGESRFTTWLHRVARNRSVDYLRRQRPTVEFDEHAHGAAFRISSMITTRETVREVLAQLPEMYREAVTLRDVEGHSYSEVARRLDRNVNTVKSHVARGRALVAARLGDDGV